MKKEILLKAATLEEQMIRLRCWDGGGARQTNAGPGRPQKAVGAENFDWKALKTKLDSGSKEELTSMLRDAVMALSTSADRYSARVRAAKRGAINNQPAQGVGETLRRVRAARAGPWTRAGARGLRPQSNFPLYS